MRSRMPPPEPRPRAGVLVAPDVLATLSPMHMTPFSAAVHAPTQGYSRSCRRTRDCRRSGLAVRQRSGASGPAVSSGVLNLGYPDQSPDGPRYGGHSMRSRAGCCSPGRNRQTGFVACIRRYKLWLGHRTNRRWRFDTSPRAQGRRTIGFSQRCRLLR